MGCVQMLMGFYVLARFLYKKAHLYFYFVFALFGIVIINIPTDRITEFTVYILLLTAGGVFACHADWKSVVLYSALTVGIMQLSYGIVNSLLSILYPMMSPFNQAFVGVAFMLLGNITSLLLAVLCYYTAYQYFSFYETMKKQYVLMVLTPILLVFLMGEYINSIIYGDTIDSREIMASANHFSLFAI